MNRTVVYLTNENPFYLRMLSKSVEMLVSHLKSPLDIKVFLIRDGARMTIERSGVGKQEYKATGEWLATIRDLGVEILEHEPSLGPEGDFFHAERSRFYTLKTDSLLYIDADTFIFGDVNDLFDKYASYDFVAAEAEWVKGRDFPADVFHPDVKPFSSGVMLWNNGWHHDWADQLKDWIWQFRTRRHPLSKWLYEQHANCLLREEFAATAWVDYRREKLKFGYFRPDEVCLIRYSSDFDKLGEQIIFHSYTPNWKEARNRLEGVAKPKVPKMRLKK